MVDNFKSAVLKRIIGEAPVFNPTYLDFAITMASPSPLATSAKETKKDAWKTASVM